VGSRAASVVIAMTLPLLLQVISFSEFYILLSSVISLLVIINLNSLLKKILKCF
jgi:hypothetical protein